MCRYTICASNVFARFALLLKIIILLIAVITLALYTYPRGTADQKRTVVKTWYTRRHIKDKDSISRSDLISEHICIVVTYYIHLYDNIVFVARA